jgi:hypothetical protein
MTAAELTLYLSACPFGEMIRRSEAFADLVEDGLLEVVADDGEPLAVFATIALPILPAGIA